MGSEKALAAVAEEWVQMLDAVRKAAKQAAQDLRAARFPVCQQTGAPLQKHFAPGEPLGSAATEYRSHWQVPG